MTSDARRTTIAYTDGTTGPQPWQQWADTAAAPGPGGTVTLHVDETCPAPYEVAEGCSFEDGQIWVRPSLARNETRPLFLHELGHQFDYLVMTDAYRAGFEKILRDTRPWRAAPNGPFEQFAEAYQLCARGITWSWPTYHEWRSLNVDAADYGYIANPRQQRRVCNLIRRAGAA